MNIHPATLILLLAGWTLAGAATGLLIATHDEPAQATPSTTNTTTTLSAPTPAPNATEPCQDYDHLPPQRRPARPADCTQEAP